MLIERGAGAPAQFPDALYKQVEWADTSGAVLDTADILLTVQPLTLAQIGALKAGAIVVGYAQAHAKLAEEALRDGRITHFAMEFVPRISRAQSMDALSSQAAIAGYKAVLIAADHLQKFMPMLTTAADHPGPRRCS